MISALAHKITALVFVFILFAQNISTLVIIGEFVVNQDFIAKNLCVQKENQQGCNGKCHLMKELKDSDTDSKTTIPVKETRRFSLDAFCMFDIKSMESNHSIYKDLRFGLTKNSANLIVTYFDIDTPPPIIS